MAMILPKQENGQGGGALPADGEDFVITLPDGTVMNFNVPLPLSGETSGGEGSGTPPDGAAIDFDTPPSGEPAKPKP